MGGRASPHSCPRSQQRPVSVSDVVQSARLRGRLVAFRPPEFHHASRADSVRGRRVAAGCPVLGRALVHRHDAAVYRCRPTGAAQVDRPAVGAADGPDRSRRILQHRATACHHVFYNSIFPVTMQESSASFQTHRRDSYTGLRSTHSHFVRAPVRAPCVLSHQCAPSLPTCTPTRSLSTSLVHRFLLRSSSRTFSLLTTSPTSCGRRGRRSSAGAGTGHFPSPNSRLSTSVRVGVAAWWKACCRRPAAASIVASPGVRLHHG